MVVLLSQKTPAQMGTIGLASFSISNSFWRRALFLWSLCLAACSAEPQPQSDQPAYLIDVWQTERGLPQNIVNAIAQTPDGYLWCGTTHGLARFDGIRFKVFNGQNTPELGSARIRQLFVDRRGALWITIFEGGLIRYQDGHFSAFALPPRESTAKTIFWMADDEAGTLWVTVEDGTVFRFADGKFSLASKDWDSGGRPVFRVHNDAHGTAWVATASYLARIQNGQLVPVLKGKLWEYQFLCPSHSGGWWVQTGGKVRLWRDGQWVAEAGPWVKPDRVVECCVEDRAGRLWVASLGKGIFCYATNAPVRQITVKQGLGSDLVRVVFEDAEGNIWAGARSGGLNRLRPALFKTYGRNEGLASDLVTAVCEGRDGELWVGTDGDGVNRITATGIDRFDEAQGLDNRHVRALHLDSNGSLWVGCWAGGLYRFDEDRFTPFREIPGRDTPIAALFEDSKKRLWLGQRSLNRLVRLEDGSPQIVGLPNPTPALDITILTEDSSGTIWAGTDGNGLFRWDGTRCQRFTRRDGLSSDTVRALLPQPDGTLWIGSVDGGLCRFKNGTFTTCTKRDGLLDDVINYIADDGKGYFWFTSFQGIFRVNKQELNEFAEGQRRRIQCVAFGKSDGLPALESPGGFQPAGCRTRDGRLWFPTIKGLVVVDPANVPTNALPPRIRIEEVLVDGEVQPLLLKAGAMEISPGRHRLEFRYTGLNFSAPERVRFRHHLTGWEHDWIEAGTERTVNYGHLPPGDYEFQVNACNEAGVWNDVPVTMNFRVLPFFWQTWWFLSLAAVLGAGALAGTVFYIARRRWKQRLEHLQVQLSVERERVRIAQDIHDGVGANLTEIAWLAEIAEKESANPEEVRAQARKISGTARETVQSFDEIVWAVLPQNDTLTSLVEYLGGRVDELFENAPTRCWFTAPKALPDLVIPAELRHSFFLACKEALHNVNKHARASEVRVEVTFKAGRLRVQIEDNGCGFDPALYESGNGLRNMRKRFADLNGTFELHSEPGRGTKISMAIPVNNTVSI
jgi:ligand-binding sensor domain-containing protein/signal transduction histidine kinase